MHYPLPEGEEIRRAITWVSANVQEHPDKPLNQFVQQAIFKFDLSPRDAEFLLTFYGRRNDSN